jgi:hypothetical protein
VVDADQRAVPVQERGHRLLSLNGLVLDRLGAVVRRQGPVSTEGVEVVDERDLGRRVLREAGIATAILPDSRRSKAMPSLIDSRRRRKRSRSTTACAVAPLRARTPTRNCLRDASLATVSGHSAAWSARRSIRIRCQPASTGTPTTPSRPSSALHRPLGRRCGIGCGTGRRSGRPSPVGSSNRSRRRPERPDPLIPRDIQFEHRVGVAGRVGEVPGLTLEEIGRPTSGRHQRWRRCAAPHRPRADCVEQPRSRGGWTSAHRR